jgi:hypothetical protein
VGFLADESAPSLRTLRDLRDDAIGTTPAKVRLEAAKALLTPASQPARAADDVERLRAIAGETGDYGDRDEMIDIDVLTTEELEDW